MFGNSAPLVIVTGVILLLIVFIGLTFSRLYRRSSKELAFVRTGMSGEKVIMDGGALVFPILHEMMPVNMNTLRLLVDRRETSSLITKDRMRVDVQAEFYVRVGKTKESIATAAQTLGRKTLAPEELKQLIEGKFVDALRSVASGMEMKELHEKRPEFVSAVRHAVQADLEANGLELESVSLTGFDQTDRKYFNENNAFDAEGLTKLTAEIEERKKLRNEIEQTTRVAIETRTIEADKETLLVQRDGELARIAQQQEIDEQTARTNAEVARTREEQRLISEQASIATEQAVEESKIDKQKRIDIAEQVRAIEVANKSKEEAAAKAEADKARGEAVKAEEQVVTVREMERANRIKAIAITKAEEEAQKGAVEIRVAADAEKTAAIDRAEAVTIAAKAEAESETVRAEAVKARALAEAEGLRAKNAAENSLSAEAMALRQSLALIGELSKVIEASVKPIEKIDSIKVVQMNGGIGGAAGVAENPGSGVNGIVNGALQFRAQAPLVDHLLQSVGLAGDLSELVSKGASGLISKALPASGSGATSAEQA